MRHTGRLLNEQSEEHLWRGLMANISRLETEAILRAIPVQHRPLVANLAAQARELRSRGRQLTLLGEPSAEPVPVHLTTTSHYYDGVPSA